MLLVVCVVFVGLNITIANSSHPTRAPCKSPVALRPQPIRTVFIMLLALVVGASDQSDRAEYCGLVLLYGDSGLCGSNASAAPLQGM